MKTRHTNRRGQKAGFTLVEIMIVVAIIGLLAAIAIPSFATARRNSQITALQNDLRIFVDAFQMYCFHNGYPPDNDPGVFPPEMEGYLDRGPWLSGPACGGQYEWHYCEGYSEFMIGIHGCSGNSLMTEFDELHDDGNPNTGMFLSFEGTYYWRFEQ